MTPDFQRAATKAYEILRDHKIIKTPVFPLHIIGRIPNIMTVSFTEASNFSSMGRSSLLNILGDHGQDAITLSQSRDGTSNYIIAYNQRLPFDMLQQALAIELGHIVLGHNTATTDEVKYDESICFAQHLLCPRPLIQAIKDTGVTPTISMVGTLTGCYGRYIAGMRKTPATHVPADLNCQVRSLLSAYVNNSLRFMFIVDADDDSPEANFGTFMDGYEE